MCLSRFLCYARHSDRNMQSLCEVCRRKQGAINVAFFYGICPKGRTRGLWERKSAPSTDGGGGKQLAPEKHSFLFLAWWLGYRTVLWRVAAKPLVPGDARVNKLFANTVFYIVTCPSAVWPVIELSRPYLHIPEIKDSCEHKGVVQSACDTERVKLYDDELERIWKGR
jgi:hypothetical protein